MPRPLNKTPKTQDKFTLVFDHNVLSVGAGSQGTAGVAATLSPAITCTTQANYVDTEIMTIIDEYGQSKVFEFDPAGDGVTAGRTAVDISGSTTAADVATVLAPLIASACPYLTVLDNLDGTIDLTHKRPGVAGNEVIITEGVANAGHVVVSPMASGAEPVLATLDHAATTALNLMTADKRMRIDRVEYLNFTGYTEDATNYWTIRLLKDATAIATYSLLDTADGTITADTLTPVPLSATDADQVVQDTDILSLSLTKVAAAVNLPPGRIFIHGRYV